MAATATVRTDLHGVYYCPQDTPHRLRPLRHLRGSSTHGMECNQPLHVVCRSCDYSTRWPCQSHRESLCRSCAARYRRRVRSVAYSGMQRERGNFYHLTLTAPGDKAHRLPNGQPCPCTPVGGVELARWNADHSVAWNRFITALRFYFPDLQYFRGIEAQDRGALHDHVLIWLPIGALEVPEVRRLAIQAGFGHSLELQSLVPGSRKASAYVSKYVTKSCDVRASVPWLGELLNPATGEVTIGRVPGKYRTWSMSESWGTSMGEIRARAAAYARKKTAEAVELRQAAAIGVVSEICGPTTSVEAADDP